ncbi:O-antigen ligase family protein [Billgrantia azerbaijanica]|nr:O-antigen ligase family protein [Halomonas azerbaijanica]
MAWLVGLAVFWQGAFTLVVPLAQYAVPIVLSAGMSARPWRRWSSSIRGRAQLLLPGIVALLLGVSWVGMGLWHGEAARAWWVSWPAWLALPMLLALLAWPPPLGWLFAGMAAGGVASAVWAAWLTLLVGRNRAEGPEPLDAILFGNLGLLLGLFCLAGLGWAWGQLRRAFWVVVLLAGALGGLLTSALSGTRGGWIVLPLLLWVLYWGYGRLLPRGGLLGLLLGLIVLGATLYAVPQTRVEHLLESGLVATWRFLAGERSVEVNGARLEMWRGAVQLVAERPLTGWGASGYQRGMARLSEQGRIDPEAARFWHAHHDLLDAWVKWGLPGVLLLACYYATPLWLFRRGLGARDPACRALALCGVLLPVAFIGYGLSYSFMAYSAVLAIYTSWLVILWGAYATRCRAGCHSSLS